ncbi:hypothetical protein [Paraburkholderia sp. BL25I1N1]|nr:hypothetical protein [Paraburkholderia sp. BL25I1N1]
MQLVFVIFVVMVGSVVGMHVKRNRHATGSNRRRRGRAAWNGYCSTTAGA